LEKWLRAQRRVPAAADAGEINVPRVTNFAGRIFQRMVARSAEILKHSLQLIRLSKYVL